MARTVTVAAAQMGPNNESTSREEIVEGAMNKLVSLFAGHQDPETSSLHQHLTRVDSIESEEIELLPRRDAEEREHSSRRTRSVLGPGSGPCRPEG